MKSDLLKTRITSIKIPAFSQPLAILFLSICLQLVLATLFGHQYDIRIFMATGRLVAVGENPYVAHDLALIFNNPSFKDMNSVGYFPPWPILLGIIYRVTYAANPNLFLYNLAIKIPIIAANIGLAFLVIRILTNLGAIEPAVRRAWVFMLFNPAILYFSAAWGQVDPLVALLSLYALLLIYTQRTSVGAILLALAISTKPTAMPIFLASLIYLLGLSLHQAVRYTISFLVALIGFIVVPFTLFGWDPSPIFLGWNAHFSVGGAMSLFSFWELIEETYQLPAIWQILGLLWIPVLVFFALRVYKAGILGFEDLLMKSTGLVMVFFLTRTWLSEPNLLLVLPFILILTAIGKINKIALTAVWLLPLVFTIFNVSPPQLLFPFSPELMQNILLMLEPYKEPRLVIRTVLVIPWLVAGWWIVVTCFKKEGAPKEFGWR